MASEIKVDTIVNAGGDNDSGIDLSTNDKIGMKIANSEVVTVDTTGVVLNENSVDRDFRVESNGNANMLIVDGGSDIMSIGRAVNSSSTLAIQNKDDINNNAIDIYNDNGNRTFSIQQNTSGDAQFKAFKNDGTQTFTLLGSGRLLLGTTDDVDQAMRIKIDGSSPTYAIKIHNSKTSSTRNFIEFGVNSSFSAVGSITSNGSSTAYNTSSDYRLKENVVTDWDATTRLKQLKPSRFNFIADADTTVDGFLAHEAQSVVPEAVVGEKDAVDSDGNIQSQAIDQSKLVPLLTKALQEAVAKIETLEAKVTALESK
jgi:hypothetical protein